MKNITWYTEVSYRDFPVVQWLRTHLAVWEMWVPFLVREIRSHMPLSK